MPTFLKTSEKYVPNPAVEEYEVAELVVDSLDVQAGFALSDTEDPRYKAGFKHRAQYGEVIVKAATILQQGSEGEDHIDAILTVTRAIDCFFLDYSAIRGSYEGLQREYTECRE